MIDPRVPVRRRPLAIGAACLLSAVVFASACGKKGPPLAPLRLVPAPVGDVSPRRTAERVELRFTLPVRNQNGPGPIELERVEIFGVTVAAGAQPPANRDLLTKSRLLGAIPVKPVPREGEPSAEDPADKRPSPGEAAMFTETIGPDQLKPQVMPAAAAKTPAAQPDAPGTGTSAPGAAAGKPGAPSTPETGAPAQAAGAPEAAVYPVRIYAIRGVTRGGRAGPAARVTIPLVDLPPAPGSVNVQHTESAYQLTWIPPVVETASDGLSFNVYATDAASPLNAQPLTAAAFEHGPVRFGEEQCFTVRTVRRLLNVPIESASSEPECVSAADRFPPAAPQGLQAVASPEGVSLSWNPNAESDLGGYVVLRGDAGGDTLRPLTMQPISETNYRDTTVVSGTTYVYAVVAVDKATPPNESTPSARQEVTAR